MSSTTDMEIYGSIAIYVAGSLASAAGIGGGILNVAIFILLWGYSFHDAAVMSIATLMGNYSSQVFINIQKRHPVVQTRPLICYPIVMILLPCELAGANAGVVLSYILPETLLLILALLVLLLAIATATERAYVLYEGETKALEMMSDDVEVMENDTDLHVEPESVASAAAGGITENSTAAALPGDGDRDRVSSSSSNSSSNTSIPNERTSLLGRTGSNNSLVAGSQSGDIPSRRPRLSAVVVPVPTTASRVRRNDDGSHNNASPGDEVGEKELPPIRVPWLYIGVTMLVWVLYAAAYCGMGLSDTCSWEYFTLLTVVYPILVVELVWAISYLIENQQEQITRYHVEQARLAEQRARERGYDSEDGVLVRKRVEDLTGGLKGDHSAKEGESTEGEEEGGGDKVGDENESLDIYVEGDMVWSDMFGWPVLLCAVLIGIISPLLGIGGGELMGPLMLMKGAPPAIMSATLPVMSLLNSSSSLVHYMSLGDVSYGYAAWVFGLGVAAGLTGRLASLYAAEHFKRPSLMVIMLIVVLLLSLGVFIYYMDTDDTDFSFSSLC